jgi:hypothetical protein
LDLAPAWAFLEDLETGLPAAQVPVADAFVLCLFEVRDFRKTVFKPLYSDFTNISIQANDFLVDWIIRNIRDYPARNFYSLFTLSPSE